MFKIQIYNFTSIPATDVAFDKLQYPELQLHFGIGPLLAQARLPDAQQVIETFAKQQGERLEDYFYLPLRGGNQDIVMALSAKDGMPVGWISISPWPQDYPQKPQ